MYGNRVAPASYYRPSSYAVQPPVVPQQPQQSVHNVNDDYERWYTEPIPNNRMKLSILSGIDTEVEWALERLVRLSWNERFSLALIPGLLDALFEWPLWFATTGYKESTDLQSLFSPSSTLLMRRQNAIRAAFVIRNALLDDQNAADVLAHRKTVPLILSALHNLDVSLDSNSEFLLYILDIFHVVAPTYIIPRSSAPSSSPLKPLLSIASVSSDRSMIIAALTELTSLFSNPQNTRHLSADSPALAACIRYLPLFTDKVLLESSLNYLYTHLSHPSMSKAFLLHADMPSVLRILVNLLIMEQVQETVTLDVTGAIQVVPSAILTTKDHQLTKAELDALISLPEPRRCYDWMTAMFVAKPDGEVTQVDFWNLYKETFQPHQDPVPLLVASDVIKNVNFVFPLALAMVQPGPPQRFIVQGVDRRKDTVLADKLKCQWDRSQCPHPPFSAPSELCEHVLQHVDAILDDAADRATCKWSSCSREGIPREQLRAHVLTHFWSAHMPERHPSQSDTITLSHPSAPYPDPNPTRRPPPLPRSTVINFQRTVNDAPSTSLLALLSIRILFRTSFASVEAAPKVDADHFGFPGVVEEIEDNDIVEVSDINTLENDKEGSLKGRRAFAAVRKLMEGVQIRDETLMGWITEMIDESSGLDG